MKADSPIRVAMVGPYPHPGAPPRGGVETAVWTLCEDLHKRDDIELIVIASNAVVTGDDVAMDPDFVIRVPHSGGLSGWVKVYHRDIPKTLARVRPDVVHIQGIASLALRTRNSVLTVHGDPARDIWHTRRGPRRVIGAFAALILERLPQALARRRIVLSPADRGVFIPNALHSAFRPRTDRRRESFVTCGEISPLKNTLGVLEAFVRIRLSHPTATLSVVGSGKDNYMAVLRNFVEFHGLQDAVFFHGRLKPEDVAAVFGASGCLVHFSNQENAPMVVVEALASGCDIIATDVGVTRDLVKDDPWSELIRPGDVDALVLAMETVLARRSVPQDRARLIEAYSPGRVSEATVAVYRHAHSQKRR